MDAVKRTPWAAPQRMLCRLFAPRCWAIHWQPAGRDSCFVSYALLCCALQGPRGVWALLHRQLPLCAWQEGAEGAREAVSSGARLTAWLSSGDRLAAWLAGWLVMRGTASALARPGFMPGLLLWGTASHGPSQGCYFFSLKLN